MTTKISDRIEKRQWFDHPIEKVWGAITETEKISQWLAPTNFKAQVGQEYALTSEDEDCDLIKGKIIEAEPYTLIYSWINQSSPDVETLVTWKLEQKENGTEVTMIHSGISKYDNQTVSKMAESYTAGWAHCFTGIENLLNT